jgi:hypothetical protein
MGNGGWYGTDEEWKRLHSNYWTQSWIGLRASTV